MEKQAAHNKIYQQSSESDSDKQLSQAQDYDGIQSIQFIQAQIK